MVESVVLTGGTKRRQDEECIPGSPTETSIGVTPGGGQGVKGYEVYGIVMSSVTSSLSTLLYRRV